MICFIVLVQVIDYLLNACASNYAIIDCGMYRLSLSFGAPRLPLTQCKRNSRMHGTGITFKRTPILPTRQASRSKRKYALSVISIQHRQNVEPTH